MCSFSSPKSLSSASQIDSGGKRRLRSKEHPVFRINYHKFLARPPFMRRAHLFQDNNSAFT